MQIAPIAVSILIGGFLGIVYYGLSFVSSQRNGRFSYDPHSSTLPFALMCMSLARVLGISYLLYIILRLPYINPILLVLTFMCVFWSIIIGKDLDLWNRLTTS